MRQNNRAEQRTHVTTNGLGMPSFTLNSTWNGLSGPKEEKFACWCDAFAACWPRLLKDGSGFPRQTLPLSLINHETSASELPWRPPAPHASKK